MVKKIKNISTHFYIFIFSKQKFGDNNFCIKATRLKETADKKVLYTNAANYRYVVPSIFTKVLDDATWKLWVDCIN